jgi:hypothetical protein
VAETSLHWLQVWEILFFGKLAVSSGEDMEGEGTAVVLSGQ